LLMAASAAEDRKGCPRAAIEINYSSNKCLTNNITYYIRGAAR
jgi:hypothetical protein